MSRAGGIPVVHGGEDVQFASLYYGGNHWVAAALAAASALGVYAVPNQGKEPPPPTGM